MLKPYFRWRFKGISHRKAWTEFDSYALCRSLEIILPSGRVDWVQCGRVTDILSDHRLSMPEDRFKGFLIALVQYRFAWWDGRRVHFSNHPYGCDADDFCRMALAAVR